MYVHCRGYVYFLFRTFAAKSKFWYMKKNNNTPSLSREGRGGSQGGAQNGAHKQPWQETYATPEEIKAMLDSRVSLRYNEVRGRPEIHWLSATMALQMIGGSLAYTLSKEEIGRAFAKLGFEYKRTAAQRGYIAIHRNGVEMEAYRRKLAEGETMTDDSMTPVW